MSERLLSRATTARRLSYTERTLDKRLRDGTGPSFVRIGRRVFIKESELDEHIKALT